MEDNDTGDPDGGGAAAPAVSSSTRETFDQREADSTTLPVVEQVQVVTSSTNNIDVKDNNSMVYLSHEDSIVRYQDGSDSGVEVNGSSGVGCGMEAEGTPAVSCDSSLISCCYSSEDLVSTTIQLSEDFRDLSINTGDGTSEGGSESSSTTGYHKPRPITNVLRKKCSSSSGKINSSNRPSTLVSSSSRSRTPMSRDRSLSSRHSSSNKTAQICSSKSLHPSSAKSPSVNPTPPSSRSRAPSVDNNSRGKNSLSSSTNKSGTKTKSSITAADDGRWPSSATRANQVNLPKTRPSPTSNIDKRLPHVMTSSFSHVETTANALEKYATLPRRHRRSAENLSSISQEQCREERRTFSREPSLNRTASLRQKHNASINNSASLHSQNIKSIPPYPNKNRTTKTRIYHEISVQTSLTGNDVENALAGTPTVADIHSRIEVSHCGVQVRFFFLFLFFVNSCFLFVLLFDA